MPVGDLVLQTGASLSNSHVHTANSDAESWTSDGSYGFGIRLTSLKVSPHQKQK